MFQITQKKARKGKGGTEKEPHQNNKMLDINSNYHFELNWITKYQLTYLIAQLVKNLPAIWETWVLSLGWEDPLEKGKLPTPVF